jgi:hypothetical protein
MQGVSREIRQVNRAQDAIDVHHVMKEQGKARAALVPGRGQLPAYTEGSPISAGRDSFKMQLPIAS